MCSSVFVRITMKLLDLSPKLSTALVNNNCQNKTHNRDSVVLTFLSSFVSTVQLSTAHWNLALLCWCHCFVCRQFAAAGSRRTGSDCLCCYYSWRDIHDTLHQTESCL